ncbi:MAG: exodeoxyribonuclease VII small subunit [Magnetococcales bacterium]|nr:exodeoxyribonuclease VII small subunit [Magnetococcales bacterium]MBF0583020.1 exodeoxyribonuclease VII small subunit [Magnetococcales bacterium]
MVSVNFEQALARLEEVAQRLERGDLPLEEGLSLFEEGMQLSRQCQDRLDAAEKRIASLSATGHVSDTATDVRDR